MESKPTSPELPDLIATGGASDVWYSSVTLWGRLNPEKFTTIKEWGIEYSTNKEEVLSHNNAIRKSSMAGFCGENNDEFFVFFRNIAYGKKLYYMAYVQTNDMQYVYGKIDSVQMLVKLTVESNNSSFGTVTGSGYYAPGTEVSITATPNNSDFTGWSDGVMEESRTVSVISDSIITAYFNRISSGTSFDDAYVLTKGEPHSASIDTGGEYVYFVFTAPASGTYTFASTGSFDTYGYLYDSMQNQISSDDDGGDNYNFLISETLSEGEMVYVKVKMYSGSATGTFNVIVN